MEQFDIVIIGGGMVGISLALALSVSVPSASSLRIALVDQRSLKPHLIKPTAPFLPRVSALTEASVNLFKNLGAWPDMVRQRVCPYSAMKVWDSEGTGEVAFDAGSIASDTLGYIVENDVIRNGLLTRLASTNVTLYASEADLSFQIDHQQNSVILSNGQILEGKLIVAADGAESPLRKAANIPLSQKDYLHHAIVTTVETERYHQDTAWQVFLDSGPLAFLPLPSIQKKHRSSIVWSLIPDQAAEIMALDSQAFCDHIGKAFEDRLGETLHAERRFCFPLRQRHAINYYRNNILLTGDAAHTIHPLAGQGVNLGLMDVAVLTEELKRALKRNDDIAGSHILDRYQRRRKGHNLLMMEAMGCFQNLFAADHIGIRWLRNTGMKTINKLPLVKESIIRQALGTTGDLPELVRAG